MKRIVVGTIAAFVMLAASLSAVAAEDERTPDAGEVKQEGAAVSIDYSKTDDAKAPDEQTYFQPFEQVLQNPALVTSLTVNADAINRSLDSLMAGVFYSLLDNERNFYFSDKAWLNAGMKRDVFSTPTGAFVVVDRVNLGPRYSNQFASMQGIPIAFGVDATVEVMQIYLRSDGMRLAEQDELPTWRRWLNNWFGLVPGFAKILPPSFNQNELYDPLRQAQTPFVFPLDTEGFYSMPIGSIRSYGFTGGVQVPMDFAGLLDQASRATLARIGNLDATAPYGVFRRGEHRIFVLRLSENSAWVGLKTVKRTGHALTPSVGKTYSLLRGALAATALGWRAVWAGVPVAVLPIDLGFEQADGDYYDQVYEYDLRKSKARDAYEAAVHGNFEPSYERWLDAREKKDDTGVIFHFTRTQNRLENLTRSGPNYAVYKRARAATRDQAEIEITDQEGKFYVLEATRDVEDKRSDILVGEEQRRIQEAVTMKVQKVIDKEKPNDPDAYTFAFEVDDDPIAFTVSYGIQDRYVDVAEYNQYIEDLQFLTGLKMRDVPRVSLKDEAREADRRRDGFFAEPTENVALLHVPPTYLGSFGATASMHFTSKVLDRIIATPSDEKWRAFAEAFGLDGAAWANPEERASFGYKTQWFKAFFLYPLRVMNVRIPSADAIREATNGIAAMDRIKTLITPREKLEAYHDLLATDHPQRLVKAILLLARQQGVPRRVTLSAQPKGAARDEIKKTFGKANGLVFTAGPPFPDSSRYDRAKKKLANFYLDQPRDAVNKPRISKIMVATKPVPDSVLSLAPVPEGDPDEVATPEENAEIAADLERRRLAQHVYYSVAVERIDAAKPLKLYVRVEQAGKIKMGKLELAAKVLDLLPASPSPDGTLSGGTYDFYLTGPLSPLSNFLFDRALVDGEELRVTVAASSDGIVWSDDRSTEFRFISGRLEAIK